MPTILSIILIYFKKTLHKYTIAGKYSTSLCLKNEYRPGKGVLDNIIFSI